MLKLDFDGTDVAVELGLRLPRKCEFRFVDYALQA